MLSRRLLLGLPSRLPGYPRILSQNASKAGGLVRPSQGGLWVRFHHQSSAATKWPMGLLLGP